MSRPVPVGRDLRADAERRERHRRRVDGEDRLRLARVQRRVVVRIPVHVDARAGDDHDRRDLDAHRGDVDAEVAGDAERAQERRRIRERRDGLEQVDVDLELAEDAGERRAHAAVRAVAAEGERRRVDTDRDGQGELRPVEGDVGEAERRAFELQRPEADRVRRGGTALDVGRNREGRLRRGVLQRSSAGGPLVGEEVDGDDAGAEHLRHGGAARRLQEVAPRRVADLLDVELHVREQLQRVRVSRR